MKAWISQIKLKNFKSYENAEFNFPEPNEGNNLILIGALNGHGKTTLLEAIYLALYGDNATEVLKKAVFYNEKKDSDKDSKDLKNLISQSLSESAILNWKQQLNGADEEGIPKHKILNKLLELSIYLELAFYDDEILNTLTIKRRWFFKFDTSLEKFVLGAKEEPDFRISNNEKINEIINEQEFLEKTMLYFPNYNRARFFLFDGEKLADIGDKNKYILGGLLDFIGINLLDNPSGEGRTGIKQELEEKLNSIQVITKTSKKNQQKLDEKQKEQQTKEQRKAKLEEDLQDLEEKLKINTDRQSEIFRELGGENVLSNQELLKRKTEKTKIQNELEQEIFEELKKIPLYLLSKDSIEQFRKRITAEYNRIRVENNRKRFDPKLDLFTKNFRAEFKKSAGKVAGKVSDIYEDSIYESIKLAWKSLFYPLQADEADIVLHNYLSELNHQDIERILNHRKNESLKDIDKAIDKLHEVDSDISELNRLMENNQGKDIESLKKEFEELQAEEKNLDNDISGLKNEKEGLVKDLENLNQEINNLRKKISSDNREAGKLERLISAIEVVKTRLILEKQLELQKNTLEIYQKISHDKRVKKVGISNEEGENPQIKFLSANELTVRAGSAGQTQLQLLSLTLALAKTANLGSPLVIDTPLGRLDEENRDMLLSYLSSLSQQVILLCQSGEINYSKSQKLIKAGKVSKTFRVESYPCGRGSKAEVFENMYFNEGENNV